MIQRIQSVWLLLAAICILLTIQLPFYSGINDPAIPYHELNGASGGFGILIVTLLVAVLGVVGIFLYKNRIVQLRLCMAAIIIELGLLFLYYKKIAAFTLGTLSLTSVLHLLVIVFFILAARGVNADEKLIKDSDRLR